MSILAISLVAVASLAEAGLATPQPAGLPPAERRDWNEPPPGTSAEDAALWHGLRDATNQAVSYMGRLVQASFRIRYGKYYESLDAVAASTSRSAAKAKEARAALEKAALDADAAVPKQGLRVRACRYTHLYLDQALSLPGDPKLAASLPEVRAEARGCVDEIGTFASSLAPQVDRLEQTIRDVDAFLGRKAPDVPQAPNPWAEPPKDTGTEAR